MMYTVYFLVLFAVNSEGKVLETKTILQTEYPRVCEANRYLAEKTIILPEDVKLITRCIPQLRTKV